MKKQNYKDWREEDKKKRGKSTKIVDKYFSTICTMMEELSEPISVKTPFGLVIFEKNDVVFSYSDVGKVKYLWLGKKKQRPLRRR